MHEYHTVQRQELDQIAASGRPELTVVHFLTQAGEDWRASDDCDQTEADPRSTARARVRLPTLQAVAAGDRRQSGQAP